MSHRSRYSRVAGKSRLGHTRWRGPRPTAPWLGEADLGVVADHEAEGAWLTRVAADLDVAAEQGGLHPAVEIPDHRAREQDRVLNLGARDLALLADSGVGADVAVAEARPGADDCGPAHRGALE